MRRRGAIREAIEEDIVAVVGLVWTSMGSNDGDCTWELD